MKLISLKVRGITSLRREQTIHFQQTRPAETLFAITGPTGSGKSSLLTAIFLALFGKAPKNLKGGDIITLGENEGLSELTFQLRGETYVARWRCRVRNKKGEPLAQPRITRELENDGRQLEKTIEDLLNLDIDQFSKTIIINQGQFAEFLTSSFKKRRKILENLCHAEVLGKIAPQLRYEIKELTQHAEVLRGKIEGGLPFDRETYLEYCRQKDAKQASLNTLREHIPPRKELLRQYEQSRKNIIQLVQMSRDRQKITAEHKESYQSYQAAWEESEKLDREIKEQQRRVKDLKRVQQLASEQLHQWEYQYKMWQHHQDRDKKLEKRKKELNDKLEEERRQKQSLENNAKELCKNISFNTPEERLGRETYDKIEEIINKLRLLQQSTDSKKKELSSLQEDLDRMSKKAKDLKGVAVNEFNSLDGRANSESVTFEKLEKKHFCGEIKNTVESLGKELKEREMQKEEAQKKKQSLQQQVLDVQKLEEKKASLTEEINTNLERHKEWKQEMDALVKKCQKLEKEKEEQEQARQAQKLYKKSLEAGYCLVCQAELSGGKHAHDPGDDETASEQLGNELEEEQKKQKEATNHHFYLSKSLKEKEDELENIEKDIQKSLNSLEEEVAFFGLDIKERSKLIQRIEEALEEREKEYIEKERERERWSNFSQFLSTEISRLQELREDYQSKSSRKKQLETEIETLAREEEGLREDLKERYPFEKDSPINSWERERSDIRDYLKNREDLNTLNQQLKNTSETLEEILKESTENQKEMNSWKETYDAENSRLRKTLKNLLQGQEGLKWGEAKESSLISSHELEESPEKVRRLLEEIQGEMDKLEHFYREKEEAQKKKLKEKEQKKNYCEQQRQLKEESLQQTKDLLLTQHSKILKVQESLISCFWWKDAHGSTFTSYKDLCDKLHRGLEKNVNSSASAFTKELNFLIENPNDKDDSFSLLYQHFVEDILAPYVETLELIAKELEQSVIQLQTNIATYEQKGQEQERWKKELAHIEKRREKKQMLEETLGRDEFSRFAMSFIEGQIMTQANWELKNLCEGRYELVTETRNKVSGPEFFVKDLWKNAAIRPINSLSGGETFLVSLAMALGLAELSRGQTDIESFIIDEGFGTLDEDAIEDVLGVLQSIQARGKQIGIISHVKGLTDRIPMNFHLEKNHFGESQVEFHYQQ